MDTVREGARGAARPRSDGPTRSVPEPFGICFTGSEYAFCAALETAVESYLTVPHGELGQHIFTYVEIGLGHGDTLVAAARYLDQIIHDTPAFRDFVCIGVDLPSYSQAATQTARRAGMLHRIEFHLVGSSAFFATFKRPLHFVFIDGCHGYPCVTQDFLGAERLIAPGGVVAFHDTCVPSQGLHMQPHCGTGIDARRAVDDLGLLSNERRGWDTIGETLGMPEHQGHGCLFVQATTGVAATRAPSGAAHGHHP